MSIEAIGQPSFENLLFSWFDDCNLQVRLRAKRSRRALNSNHYTAQNDI